MPILFDFHSDNGRVQPVTVHSNDDATFETLRRCEAGEVPGDETLLLVCKPEGADHREWMFRASRIKNVRRT